MKKNLLAFGIYLSAAFCWSCNNSGESAANTNDTGMSTMDTATTTPNTNIVSTAPLSKEDSLFVMEAATGGLMEVQVGELAQQNAQSQRVKDFGSMMVTDHSRANDELKSYAAAHGISLPASLPANEQKHIDAMKNMKGAAFDKHYVSMMVDDHQKDVAKFKKKSSEANDAQLRDWATNTLPVLQKHLDSIQAIKKGM